MIHGGAFFFALGVPPDPFKLPEPRGDFALFRLSMTAPASFSAASHRSLPPRRPGLLRSLQHFIYYRLAAGTHFIRRRVRPAGAGLLLTTCLGAFAATGNPDSPAIYQLFCLGLALVLAGLIWLPFRRARVQAVRELPPHATAGKPMDYRLRLQNLRGRRLRDAVFQETPPDPRPSRAAFAFSREPGEKERNSFDRLFVWYRWLWLCDRRALFREALDTAPVTLPGRGACSTGMSLTPARRGLMELGDLRLLVPDPLGLFQRCIRVQAAKDSVPVLPRRYALPPLELPGSARLLPGGDAASRHPGPAGDFMGLRDYQPGDPLRLIHWPTWARTGRPVVRELEDNFLPRHGLILDTFADAGAEELFEEAVSVAASFISSTAESETLIDLMFVAGSPRVVSAGGGLAHSSALQQTLAVVEPTPEEDFDSLFGLLLRHSEDLAGCLCIFTGWSPSRAQFLQKIRAAGIDCAALVVMGDGPPLVMERVHILRPASLAEDLMRLPASL